MASSEDGMKVEVAISRTEIIADPVRIADLLPEGPPRILSAEPRRRKFN